MQEQSDIQKLFEAQAEALPGLRAESARQRISRIWKIRRYLLDKSHEAKLCEAMRADLRRPRQEVMVMEVGPVMMAMNHIKANLKRWMRDRWVPAPLSMAGLSGTVRHEPKGRCLVISPWNYPLQLALNPAIHAMAAGNAVAIKPSELSPQVSNFLAEMAAELFDPKEFAVVLGEVDTATELLAQPFNHIFFTGSPGVGKIVMGAAAKNLCSVTLELGGKSPTIVDGSVNARSVGAKTAWAKGINAGQTCIAPDYGVVQEGQMKDFAEGFRQGLRKMYGNDPQQSSDFGRMVNEKHFHRVRRIVEDALEKGAELVVGGKMDAADLYIEPTLLRGVTDDMTVMQEEIFGPVLPVLTYKDLAEVPAIVAKRPQPLSFYIMSKVRKNIRFLMDHTVSGGVVVNEYMVGSLNPHLPFGGVNGSGIGKSNGRHGFLEFSNERGVVERNWGTLRFLWPPFSEKMTRLANFLFQRF